MASSCVRGGLDWILGKISYWKSGQALEQAVQCSGGVPISGGVQKMRRCGTSAHGLVGLVVLGWRLDVMILEVFSNFNDSMILWKNIFVKKWWTISEILVDSYPYEKVTGNSCGISLPYTES